MIGLKRRFRGGDTQQIVIESESFARIEFVLLFQSKKRIVSQNIIAWNQVLSLHYLSG